jgi:dynein light chain roadblock-type
MATSGIATARTSFISQPNPGTSGSMAPELESTLSLLSSHRSVLGYMLVSRGHPVSIIRHSGVIFDGDQGRRYASAVAKIVESVQSGLEEVAGENDVVSLFCAMESLCS